MRRPSGKAPAAFDSTTKAEAVQWWADKLRRPIDEADVVLVRTVPQCDFRLSGGPCLRPLGHGGEHRRYVHFSAKPWPSGGPAVWDYQGPET